MRGEPRLVVTKANGTVRAYAECNGWRTRTRVMPGGISGRMKKELLRTVEEACARREEIVPKVEEAG